MKKICFENGLPRFETTNLLFSVGNSCCLGEIQFLEPTFEGDALINLKLAYIDTIKGNQYIEKPYNELIIPDYIKEISLNFYYDGIPVDGNKEIIYTINWKRKCQKGNQDYEFFSEKVLINITSNCSNIPNQTPEIISLVLVSNLNDCSDISLYFKEVLNADKYSVKYCDENDLCNITDTYPAKDINGNPITKITLDCHEIQSCIEYTYWIQAIDLNGNFISETQIPKKYKAEPISCSCDRPDFNLIPSLIPNIGSEMFYYDSVDAFLLEVRLDNLKSGNQDFLSYYIRWRQKGQNDWQESYFGDFYEIYLNKPNQEYEIQLCGNCLTDKNCYNEQKINNSISSCYIKSKIRLTWNSNAPFSISYQTSCNGGPLQIRLTHSLTSTGNNQTELINNWINTYSQLGSNYKAYIENGDDPDIVTMEIPCDLLGCACLNTTQKFWYSSSNFAATMTDISSECVLLDNSGNQLTQNQLNPKPSGCEDDYIEWTFRINKIDDAYFGNTPKDGQSPFSILFEYNNQGGSPFNWNINESRGNGIAGWRKNCTKIFNQDSTNCGACFGSDLFTNFNDWINNFIDGIKCFYLSLGIQTKEIKLVESTNDFRITIKFLKLINMPFNCNSKFNIHYFFRDNSYSNQLIHYSDVIGNKWTYNSGKGQLQELILPGITDIRNVYCQSCPQKPCIDGLPDCNKEICGEIITITTPDKPIEEPPLPELEPCCPLEISDIKVKQVSQTEILLSWNKVPGAQNYTIRYRLSQSNNGIIDQWKEILLTPNTNSYKFINLFPDTEYDFAIKTRCTQINPSDTSLNVYKDYDWTDTLKVKTLDYDIPKSPACNCPLVQVGELVNGFNYNSINIDITNNPLNIYNRVFCQLQYLQLGDDGNPKLQETNGNPLWINGGDQFILGKGESTTKYLEKLALAGSYKFRIVTKCERFTDTFIISECENSTKIDIPIPECSFSVSDADVIVQTEINGSNYILKEIKLNNYISIGTQSIIIKIKGESKKFELTAAPFIIKGDSLNQILFTKGEEWVIEITGECSEKFKSDTIIKKGDSPKFPPVYIDVDINCVANGSRIIDSSNPKIGNNATLLLQLDSDKLKPEEQSYSLYAEIKGYDNDGNLVITRTNLNIQKNS